VSREVLINDKKIGRDHATYIIAEIGSNHNNDYDLAKKLINKAADAHVDAVKFQTFKAESLYSKKTPRFSKDNLNPFDLIKSIEMPREWLKDLKKYSESKDLDFFSSPFDFQAVDELDKLNVPAFKIASFEMVDLELLEYTAKKGKPIILSTGLADVKEIKEAVNAVISQGNKDLILLHCNSLYPAPVDVVNLNAIKTMLDEFDFPIGFSDHTMGIFMPVAAVVMGARVIEKHITLDRWMKGPDHHFAVEPDELKEMVKNIRDVEKALGDGVKRPSKQEKEMLEKGRRSIIAAADIAKGSKISRDMLVVKRPGYGIKPKYVKDLIGKKTKKEIKEDEWITWEDIEK